MINGIRIHGFKSFYDASFPLKRVTVLIGANASGKSNALEVLRFAAWIGHGDRLDDIERKLGKIDSIRGGVRDLFARGKSTPVAGADGKIMQLNTAETQFGIGLDIEADGISYCFDQTIRKIDLPGQGTHLVVADESLARLGKRTPFYKVKSSDVPLYSDEIAVAWNNFKKGGKKPVVTCSNRRAVFQQMMDDDRFGIRRGQSPVARASRLVAETLDQIVFIAPEVSKMRGYVQALMGVRLDEDGENLSAVLYDICQREQGKKDLLEFVRSIPEQNVKSIGFSRTSTGDVMVVLSEGFGAMHPTPASLLSDGTLRVLAIGAALFSAAPGAMVVVEEIDNGIHPSRARRIVELIYKIAESRGIQIVMTTHNPALMDAVPLNELPNVLCACRMASDHSSAIKRLGDLPQYVDLAALGSLGRAATTDELAKMVRSNMTSSELVRQRTDWLERFTAEFGGEA